MIYMSDRERKKLETEKNQHFIVENWKENVEKDRKTERKRRTWIYSHHCTPQNSHMK